ncbi:MAG: DUF1127 domain-containing protein [Sedimenticola sp.]|nr:DUF1127 domain-containing protein [Sedimenticola sp.]
MEITLLKRFIAQPIPVQARRQPFMTYLSIWIERTRQRRALLRLNDRMLSDIGRSRCEAEAEANKPFWKA